MKDYSALIDAMKEFNTPENQYKRLLEEWKDATDISALYFILEPPQSDGDIEIIFVPSDKAEKELDKFLKHSPKSNVAIISFEEGCRFVQQGNCSGGECEKERLQQILRILKPQLH